MIYDEDDLYLEDDDTSGELLDDRPIFSDKQVLNRGELKPGVKYRIHLHNNPPREVMFFRLYEEELGTKIATMSGSSYYLTDIGILPYFSGKWNPTNWVEIL